MKNLRRFCATVVLTFVLALSAFAGDISCPGIIPLPPRSMVAGDMETSGATAPGKTSAPGVLDPVTEAALSLLQSILSLF